MGEGSFERFTGFLLFLEEGDTSGSWNGIPFCWEGGGCGQSTVTISTPILNHRTNNHKTTSRRAAETTRTPSRCTTAYDDDMRLAETATDRSGHTDADTCRGIACQSKDYSSTETPRAGPPPLVLWDRFGLPVNKRLLRLSMSTCHHHHHPTAAAATATAAATAAAAAAAAAAAVSKCFSVGKHHATLLRDRSAWQQKPAT